MRRFAFRLARLERIREVRRQEARVALAEAVGRLRDTQRERIERERRWTDGAACELPDGLRGDARSWKQRAAWLEARRTQCAAAARREADAGRAAGAALERHTEAARELRVLERLRQRRFRRWLQEAELEERRFLDEIHQLRVARERGACRGRDDEA